MRNSITKVATFTLVAGAMILPAVPAAAGTATTTTTVAAKASDQPYSIMKVGVRAPKTVKRGGKIQYRIDVLNTGPHQADYYWVGGKLPKGIVNGLRYNGPKGTQCDWDPTGFWCWGPWELEKGDKDWLDIQVTLKKGTRGTATAQLGALVYDIPIGMENMDKEEIDRIGGFKSWFYGKKVKTKIVR
ncbi:hypothetical protein ACIBHY_23190 [Nonomuraea sp. NPDC050547]|uniref:hypothetical protein n=1 Tax=Nonomuraea sp. NPDC050547 TaxID=3364368 RepID=UPI0037B8589B